MQANQVLRRIMLPLASRKVRVAIATVVAAYAGQYGLGLSEEMVFTILGVGSAVILGIAHEDAGQSKTSPVITRTAQHSERIATVRAVTARDARARAATVRER